MCLAARLMMTNALIRESSTHARILKNKLRVNPHRNKTSCKHNLTDRKSKLQIAQMTVVMDVTRETTKS